ncbi:molybdopterin synthase catalytic subunit [Orussus abietinus]|uniref:molybdopterin synthase catalytic subunit n=1 Tax=Orussus abietinus TaxID=222816 RepID=UPI000626B677|nr:molybdopterin synthase catalytic subunit [Orussus abietinus]XP_023290558.1 molybdopterin synthase catalytic subunit [Orussus abietinus]
MDINKNIVKLQKEKLNAGNIINLAVSPNCGAISSFIGITRDNFENKKVVKLEYEAYEPMALKEMQNICLMIRSKWNVEYIVIYHRIGDVPISEASVVIAISSPHRTESLQAVQFAIDTLKASVPIWKKEVYDNEEPQWKENKECVWSTNDAAKDEKGTVRSSTICKNRNTINDTKSGDESITAKLDTSLVQIQADSEELNRRIQAFIARKREQVNVANVQEFCCRSDRNEEKEESCARVDAVLIRHKDSKSHVKVHRVLNSWGPQTVDPLSLYKSTCETSQQSSDVYPPALDERLSHAEKNLGLNRPVPRSVYERLKQIEDRLLYLESISPEYSDFWRKVDNDDDSVEDSQEPIRKRKCPSAELDSKMYDLECRYFKKI